MEVRRVLIVDVVDGVGGGDDDGRDWKGCGLRCGRWIAAVFDWVGLTVDVERGVVWMERVAGVRRVVVCACLL